MTRRPSTGTLPAARAFGWAVAVTGLAYLLWRVVVTSAGAAPWLFWTLLGAEALAWGAVVLATATLRPEQPPQRLAPLDVVVDIVVLADGEDLDLIEPSVIASLAVRGRTRVHLYDANGRVECRALAERFGVHCVSSDDHAALPETIDDVLPDLTGRLLLVLRAGQVPAPDVISALSGYFALESMAAVEIDTDSTLSRDPLALATARARRAREAADRAVLLRLSALRAIGGTVIVDGAARSSAAARLRDAGYATVHVRESLITEAAPESDGAGRRPLPAVTATSARQLALDLLRVLVPAALVVCAVAVGIAGLAPAADPGMLGLAIVAAHWLLVTGAAAALRGADALGLDTLTATLVSIEPRIRAIVAAVRRTDAPAHDPDATTRSDILRLVRVPITVASIIAVVLGARGLDTLARSAVGDGPLPPLAPGAWAPLLVGGALPILATAVLLLRLGRRERLHRHLRRFPTELSARVRGITVACVDLHQRGAALIVPQELAEGASTLTFAVACRALSGSSAPAHGTMTVTSRRAVDPEGTMVRIGGPVVWNDDESRGRVITHCYVVEPYAARKRTWEREAPRIPVALEATIDGSAATCVDVSSSGAALVTRDGHWVLEDRVPIEITLPTGETATGDFRVRNLTATPAGLVRLGGTVEWASTEWLVRYGAAPAEPSARRGREASSAVSAS